MTTAGQHIRDQGVKRPEHRASFGRDILSRMLLLEKQSKVSPSNQTSILRLGEHVS